MKILLVEDHTLFRLGLRHLLREIDNTVRLDDAANCAQALERLGHSTYDLVLLDLKLPEIHGLDGLTALRQAQPSMPIVVLSGEDHPDVVHQVIEAGAMGFIPKSSTPEVLIDAMRLVLSKRIYLPPSALDNMDGSERAPAPTIAVQHVLPGLTSRQMEVLYCIVRGKPNKVIARELNLSEGTVKSHVAAVFHALAVHNRTGAVYAAAKLGLHIA